MLNGSGDLSPADFGDLEAPDGGKAFGEESVEKVNEGSVAEAAAE